jgi:predicted TPR repeat methyltransferase
MAESGDLDGASALIAEAVKDDARWLETLRRLVTVDRLSAEKAAAIEARVSK